MCTYELCTSLIQSVGLVELSSQPKRLKFLPSWDWQPDLEVRGVSRPKAMPN